MPEKPEPHDAPPDYTPFSTAAGVSGKNIARTLDAAHADEHASADEHEAFVAVRAPVSVAEYRIGVLSKDLERHLISLRQNIRIRTAEGQAELALSDLEEIIGELLVAQDVLLGVLGRSDTEAP